MTASLHAILSRHALARMQQRGIPPVAVEHVLRYGRERHDRHGAVVLYLDKSARERLKRCGEAREQEIERIRAVYVVLSTDGTVATVGHRYRRLHR
jgi:hypothetical protein